MTDKGRDRLVEAAHFAVRHAFVCGHDDGTWCDDKCHVGRIAKEALLAAGEWGSTPPRESLFDRLEKLERELKAATLKLETYQLLNKIDPFKQRNELLVQMVKDLVVLLSDTQHASKAKLILEELGRK